MMRHGRSEAHKEPSHGCDDHLPLRRIYAKLSCTTVEMWDKARL